MNKPAQNLAAEPRRIGNRYEIQAVLGRGGMACVYRATDLVTGREIALKELELRESSRDRASVTTLFEREFHTLSQLAHPRVIAVYDYGVTDSGPFYTMELLDGGDLRERSPMPWREACELLFDVCSSLALLHSRRLLHRDISPRNIRCTRDGKAKLIDFGAMASMGSGGAPVVGTPAYTPPETVHRLAVDARADLFSLGVTLYTALTGQMPYPARTFAEALAAWKSKPVPPSARMADVPPALDDLVLSLISIEPALRPASAFDVMQRLAAIAGLQRDESAEVSAAYLVTPTLVGRDELLALVRERIKAALNGHGGAVLLRGAAGQGRSRMLDACALEAKTLGATVLRATASGEPEAFAVARTLIEQLLAGQTHEGLPAAYPELFEAAAAANENAAARAPLKAWSGDAAQVEGIQQALVRFIVTASRTQPSLLAVDDVHRCDPQSAAVLAALIDKLKRGNVAVVLTAEGGAADLTVEVLARRCTVLDLPALTREQTQMLLASLFGDVSNLEMLTAEIHDVAGGNPRYCMDMAQHLVDRQVIRYAAGTWTLPEVLSTEDLPRNEDEALRAKLARLSEAAREIAQAHALAYYELFSAEDYRALRPLEESRSTDHALNELLVLGVVSSAGNAYRLTNRLWNEALRGTLTAETTRERHRALAEVYRPRVRLAAIYHLFEAGAEEQGLAAFAELHQDYAKGATRATIDPNLAKLAPTYRRAIQAAIERKCPVRQLADLQRWTVGLSVAAEGEGYYETAPAWFEQVKRDSGLAAWQADTESATPGDRLTRALQSTYERYVATPEAERVYPVDEAIKLVAEYVVISIAIGVRMYDTQLLASLPPLLEPFAPLSPILDAIWNNAIATADTNCNCRIEAARERWIEVLRKLDAPANGELSHIDAVRNAVAYGVGLMEAQLGLATATNHAARLEQDPFQKLSAIQLRKIVRLEQGDWAGAERLRRDGEVLALQIRTLNMFNSLLMVELTIYVMAADLSGIQQSLDQLRLIAAKCPGWEVCVLVGEGYFEMVRGDIAAAIRKFEDCTARVRPGPDGNSPALNVWIFASAGLTEALVNAGRAEQAREVARAALAYCEARQVISVSHDLTRALAIAEATLREYAPAIQRLDALIASQTAAGFSGPRLGLSYEARARIAIWNEDEAAFERYSRLAASEYRRGAHSPLAARYERLVNEALRAGFHATTELSDFEPSTMLDVNSSELLDVQTAVLRAMTGAQRSEDRAKRALRLLCEARAAAGGHLYLVGLDQPKLAASYGAVADPENLADSVREFLAQEQSRAETMTEIVTGTLLGEIEVAQSTVRAGGSDYELLLLTCIVDGAGVVAGVAALVKGERRVHYVRQTQLLNTLAAHLIQSGDAIGTRFELG